MKKTRNIAILLLALTGLTTTFAKESLTESIQNIYASLRSDFEANPYFSNRNINAGRDKRQSPYMTSILHYDANNAWPVAGHAIARLPDFEFLDPEIFRQAMIGYYATKRLNPSAVRRRDVLTVVDFSQRADRRRLYVFDLKNRKTLFNTWVAHGSGTDPDRDGIADFFGNGSGSHMSSLGFYTTLRIQPSENFRLRLPLVGIDRKLNGNTLARGVIMHEWGGGDPASIAYAHTFLNTQGCFGISPYESGKFYGLADRPLVTLIEEAIAGGSLIFAYADDRSLPALSRYLDEAAAEAAYRTDSGALLPLELPLGPEPAMPPMPAVPGY